MGQRLVIKVRAFNEDVAAIYYHWSGYTVSALCEVRNIINHEELFDCKDKDEFLYRLIRVVESAGGGIDGGEGSAEWNRITKKYQRDDFAVNPNRNFGLIAISDEDIGHLESCAEEEIEIDFDEETVFGGAFYEYESLEDMNRDCEDCEQDTLDDNDIYETKIDPGSMDFADIEDAIAEFEGRDYVKNGVAYYEFIR